MLNARYLLYRQSSININKITNKFVFFSYCTYASITAQNYLNYFTSQEKHCQFGKYTVSQFSI